MLASKSSSSYVGRLTSHGERASSRRLLQVVERVADPRQRALRARPARRGRSGRRRCAARRDRSRRAPRRRSPRHRRRRRSCRARPSGAGRRPARRRRPRSTAWTSARWRRRARSEAARNDSAASSKSPFSSERDALLGGVAARREVVARLRRGGAEAGRRDAGDDHERAGADQRQPGAPATCWRTNPVSERAGRRPRRLIERRRPEAGVELGAGEDVEREAERGGEHVRAVAAGRADPQRGGEGDGRQHASAAGSAAMASAAPAATAAAHHGASAPTRTTSAVPTASEDGVDDGRCRSAAPGASAASDRGDATAIEPVVRSADAGSRPCRRARRSGGGRRAAAAGRRPAGRRRRRPRPPATEQGRVGVRPGRGQRSVGRADPGLADPGHCPPVATVDGGGSPGG